MKKLDCDDIKKSYFMKFAFISGLFSIFENKEDF